MKKGDVNPRWLKALRADAQVSPLRPRVPLVAVAAGGAGGAVIGSVEPAFLSQIKTPVLADGSPVLQRTGRGSSTRWLLHGDASTSLALLADALRESGLAHAWRNEQLGVPEVTQTSHAQGRRVGTVERAVVRVLGITTYAVHLIGQTPGGLHWVQQRAFNKSNDPGLWDTLMGGMVSAADTLETALERETWEEAGLALDSLQDVIWGGRITTRRPAADGGGAGYVIEHIDWYRCTVPHGARPVNQDGEVERFEQVTRAQLLAGLQQAEFTAEAALIYCDAL